eukprot:symbB.v1.2.015445.t2/scaffold1114.1/size137040/3
MRYRCSLPLCPVHLVVALDAVARPGDALEENALQLKPRWLRQRSVERWEVPVPDDRLLQGATAESEALSQLPLPRFACSGGSEDVRPDPNSQSSQHPSVLQQELLKLEQQQILWMKLQLRQKLAQRVQELQGQLLLQQGVGHDNGGYPMASSPYLESPVQASMGSWSEIQMENETWSKPKVKVSKAAKTPKPKVRGAQAEDTQNQLPKANLNKTDDKNTGGSTAGMVFPSF